MVGAEGRNCQIYNYISKLSK